jgi:hypothetical protein
VAGQDGGPQASVTLLPTRKNSSACLRLAGAHFQWRRANDPCWKPVAAPDEPAGQGGRRRSVVADAHATGLVRPERRRLSCPGRGEGWRFCWPTRSWCVREYAADVHYAPTAGSANKTSRLGSCMRCTVLVTCVRLATRLPGYPDVFDTNVRLQLALQIRQGAAAGASGKSSRHKADRGIIKWRASTGPH